MKTNALVLMDSDPDMTLTAMSTKFNPSIHLDFLVNKKNPERNQKKAGYIATTSRK
jgi:hypothetical protein